VAKRFSILARRSNEAMLEKIEPIENRICRTQPRTHLINALEKRVKGWGFMR
jgi:hypothetical protein